MNTPDEATLRRILDYYDWPVFEARPCGDLRLSEWSSIPDGEELTANPESHQFYMRVGLHLGRPTQAIFSNGKFLQIRREKRFDGCDFKKIDPNKPDECLYEEYKETATYAAHPQSLQGLYNQYGMPQTTLTTTGPLAGQLPLPFPGQPLTVPAPVFSWRPRNSYTNPHLSTLGIHNYNQPAPNFSPLYSQWTTNNLTSLGNVQCPQQTVNLPTTYTVTTVAASGLGYAPQLPRVK